MDQKADLYIHTGDLFDQISPRNPPRANVIEGFRKLTENGVKCYIIAGNHEAPGSMGEGASPHAVLSEAGFAKVFEKTQSVEQEKIEVRGIEVSVSGISYNQRLSPGSDPLQGIKLPGGSDYNIALLHYPLERIAPSPGGEPQIRLGSVEDNPGIQLFAMGHIHKHIYESVGDSHILYPGATEHFDFGESEHPTGFCYVTVDEGKTRSRFISLESQPMKRIKLHSSSMPKENPTNHLLEKVRAGCDEKGLMQLIVEGELPFDEYTKIDWPTVFDEGSRSNFYFEYEDRLKPIIEGFSLNPKGGLQPRRELANYGVKYIEKAEGEDKLTWERALELALSAYDKVKEGG